MGGGTAMECVSTSMPAIIAEETIQCPSVTSLEFKQKVTQGNTMNWGGIKNLPCLQNNNLPFPKDQNKTPTPINADQLVLFRRV